MQLAWFETYSVMIPHTHTHLLRGMERRVEQSEGQALQKSLQGRELDGTLQLINGIPPVNQGR